MSSSNHCLSLSALAYQLALNTPVSADGTECLTAVDAGCKLQPAAGRPLLPSHQGTHLPLTSAEHSHPEAGSRHGVQQQLGFCSRKRLPGTTTHLLPLWKCICFQSTEGAEFQVSRQPGALGLAGRPANRLSAWRSCRCS